MSCRGFELRESKFHDWLAAVDKEDLNALRAAARHALPGVLSAILGRQVPLHERPHVLERRQRQWYVGKDDRARQRPAPVVIGQG